MAMLKIDGVEMPAPSELKVEIFEVGSEEVRSAAGNLVVDRVAVRRRLKLKWAYLSTAQMGALLGAVSAPFFSATYPDPELGERTMVCRSGAKAAGLLRMLGGEPVWVDVGMEWTEK